MRFIFTIKLFLLFIWSITFIALFRNYKIVSVQYKCDKIDRLQVNNSLGHRGEHLKYILLWTSPSDIPFAYMGEGRRGFIERECRFTNCVVTSNRTLLGSYIDFDVIMFAGPELVRRSKRFLPKRRSPLQKYVFASIESSQNYPVCSNRFDSYFNWTWTYRLDSEVRWGYIVIKDLNGNVVGPNKEMDWLPHDAMLPVSDEFKAKLKKKTKAAAWFVSNCISVSGRELFVTKLNRELDNHNLVIDIYGDCSMKKCLRDNEECYSRIDKDYYFYLSFENAFSEDYVTEKLLIALQNNAVPIVYGGANYSRYLPSNSYLNARELGVSKLALKMLDLIQNPDEYANYFRWKNHYSYHKTSESVLTDEYCKMCSLLNDKNMLERPSVLKNFREWWDPPNHC